MSERFRIYIAAYLFLEKDGELLLAKRQNTGYGDGEYSMVAGHFDGEETAAECIIREAKEEAGIILTPEDLEVIYVMHRIGRDREYIDVYLKTTKWEGEIQNMEPEKCSELKFFSKNAIPENTVSPMKKALEDIKNGLHYGEFGWDKR